MIENIFFNQTYKSLDPSLLTRDFKQIAKEISMATYDRVRHELIYNR